MEIFQELNFTLFLAIILSLIVAKLVSFAVSNSCNHDNTALCCVTEISMEKDLISERRLRVKSTKDKKRVRFVDDVEVKKVDLCEAENGSAKTLFLDEADSTAGVIVEENKNGNIQKWVPQSEDGETNNDFQMTNSENEDFNDEGVHDRDSELIEMQIGKNCEGDDIDVVVGENEKKSIIVEGHRSEIECSDFIINRKEENVVSGSGENVADEIKVREEGADEYDDWEGIERSELEKVFAEAVNFMEYGGRGKAKDNDVLAKLDSNVKMKLYGLHKVAVEGPCRHAQPMALMVSSRAKWNAWRDLGSMSQEEAMEKYIRTLSDCVPAWMRACSAKDETPGSSMFETTNNSGSILRCVPEDDIKNNLGDCSTGIGYIEKDKD